MIVEGSCKPTFDWDQNKDGSVFVFLKNANNGSGDANKLRWLVKLADDATIEHASELVHLLNLRTAVMYFNAG